MFLRSFFVPSRYLGSFLFIRCWAIFNRVQNWAYPGSPVFALAFAQALFSPLQGFCNSLVYGVNKKAR